MTHKPYLETLCIIQARDHVFIVGRKKLGSYVVSQTSPCFSGGFKAISKAW